MTRGDTDCILFILLFFLLYCVLFTFEKGGGLIKFEAWEYENEIVKYNMVYINKSVFPNDNGRVVGYDNSHNFHHKYYMGQIRELDDFVSYQKLVA